MMIKADYPINEDVLRDLHALTEDYDILTSTEVGYNNSQVKTYLNDSIPNKCRFCNKEFPDVNFKKIAHAIPEFTGNKSLVSKYECDNCNQYFSQFESELANYMLPYNALGGVKKKGNKFPKYKQGIEVYHPKENSIHIDNYPNEINSDTKECELILDIPSYIPDFIYRCLIKIGLTLIPENSIEKYKEVLDWLMDKSSDTIFPACMLFSIFPFENPSDKIRCVIYTRKESILEQSPAALLILSYQNFAIQTFFPVTVLEISSKELKPFPFAIPSPLDFNLNLVTQKLTQMVELRKKERIKGEKVEFLIQSLE